MVVPLCKVAAAIGLSVPSAAAPRIAVFSDTASR